MLVSVSFGTIPFFYASWLLVSIVLSFGEVYRIRTLLPSRPNTLLTKTLDMSVVATARTGQERVRHVDDHRHRFSCVLT